MKIAVFTFCEFFKQYGEQSVIIGATNQLGVGDLPGKVSGCIAIRLIMEQSDEGEHHCYVTISDADGGNVLKIEFPPFA